MGGWVGGWVGACERCPGRWPLTPGWGHCRSRHERGVTTQGVTWSSPLVLPPCHHYPPPLAPPARPTSAWWATARWMSWAQATATRCREAASPTPAVLCRCVAAGTARAVQGPWGAVAPDAAQAIPLGVQASGARRRGAVCEGGSRLPPAWRTAAAHLPSPLPRTPLPSYVLPAATQHPVHAHAAPRAVAAVVSRRPGGCGPALSPEPSSLAVVRGTRSARQGPPHTQRLHSEPLHAGHRLPAGPSAPASSGPPTRP